MLNAKQKIVTGSVSVSVVLILIGIALGDIGILSNLVIIAAFISIVPFFIWKYSKFMWLKSLEAQFPNFIRDLADSKRSGMSFPEAIRIAARSNYGKLSPEVEKMKNRLSWGTPFLRVLEIFGNDVKDSKTIKEALNIIKESYQSGGNIANTLESVAGDIVMIKEAEAERISLVRQQVMLMYGLFYMFMAISVVIIFVMVPMIQSAPAAVPEGASGGTLGAGNVGGLQFSDPCTSNSGTQVSAFPCALFSSICALLDQPEGISCYYLAMFFSIILIQGLFTGLIAGQLGEGSVVAGSKHALIMVFSAIGVLLFLAKAGFLPA
jgi:flagellar protein FlaJ